MRAEFARMAADLKTAYEYVVSLPDLLQQKFRDLLDELFVPEAGLFDRRLAELRSRFGIFAEIADTGDHLLALLQSAAGVAAPVITIDLSAKGGMFDWGAQVIRIDFAWYTPYKPLVDNVVAGIIWITFLWHLYKRLPEIIHGQGMLTARVANLAAKEDD